MSDEARALLAMANSPDCPLHPFERETLRAAAALLSKSGRKDGVFIPADEWDQFVADYNRYNDGDPKMDFQTLRLSLSIMLEVAIRQSE